MITSCTATWWRLWILALALLIAPAINSSPTDTDQHSKTFFRITNEQGGVELKANITPKEAKRGYSVMTLGGIVVKTVAAELSDEEYAQLSETIKTEHDERERLQKERLYDESLLLRYSAVIDLEAEQKRKLSEFDLRISILRSNLYSLKEKMLTQQALAANIERRGIVVPTKLNDNIADIEAEMKDAEISIAARTSEKALVDKQYNEDAKRLAALLKAVSR